MDCGWSDLWLCFCFSSHTQSVMDQFNPGLRNLVNLGKNYEKSVTGEYLASSCHFLYFKFKHLLIFNECDYFPAMTLAAKLYFDAMSKIGESAAVSPVSRELGRFLLWPQIGHFTFWFVFGFLYYYLMVDFGEQLWIFRLWYYTMKV